MIERAFVYGDLLFETIRVKDGLICFADKHFKRLLESAKVLKYETDTLTYDIFIQAITGKLAGNKNARIRFILYRKSDGFYTPVSNTIKWEIEIFPFVEVGKVCERLGVFTEYKKSCQQLSNLKSGNALIYVLAGLYAKQINVDDCLILNEYGRIAEAISSNIFILKDEVLITPPLSEGCVDGVMRKVLLDKAKQHGLEIEEKAIEQHNVMNADEVFLTNAINGIVSVNAFQSKIFSTNFTTNLKSTFDF